MIDYNSIPVTMVKGVSAAKQQELHAFGISTVADLLLYFPYRYEDFHVRRLDEVKDGEKITIEGRIVSTPVVQRFGKKSKVTVRIMVEEWLVSATWFNRPYMREQLTQGRDVVVTGKWDQRRLQITVATSEFADRGAMRKDTLQPVYSVRGKITQNWMRKTIAQAMLQFSETISEVLPAELMRRYRLMPRKQAIAALHNPQDAQAGKQARRRMVYEELLLFQLKLHAFRALNRERADGVAHEASNTQVKEFVRSLPFELTDGQKGAVTDILADMRSPYCMNRLLQGDVGSGKTVVSAIALYASVCSGYQGALMVPTEILAEQHMRSLMKLFEPHGIQIALLTGSVTGRKRKDVLAGLQMGAIDILVGTHALIQEDVFFKRLGLVVTDEQHRFGVNQRSILRRKGMNPDVLLMTATPIPRTLAITAFGDMDVTSIKDRPAGRKPIKTYWVKHEMLERVLGFIRREVDQGRQAYMICPLIEESDKLDVQNAIDVHVQMQQAFPNLSVGLLHGRMSAAEKDEAMRAFSSGSTHLLVSTTVIEVGVDVPNSTLMIIMDAERFGLSQLHQLRGRVGRGEHQSYCVLIADPKSEVGKERMRIMTETEDGFELSQRDLELRGPGDFFGTKQSGLPEFKLADMASDFAVLEQAREDAAELIGMENFWTTAEYRPLHDMLKQEQLFQGELLD